MKDRLIKFWEPRVGAAGALAYWQWQRWVVYGRRALFLFIAVFAVGAHFHSVLIEVASYVIPAAIFVGLLGFQPKAKWKFAALASEALGIPIERGNFPPRTDDHYAAWCAKNGIVPCHPRNVPKT